MAATLAAYHNALTAGFVLDDYHYILEHRELGVARIPWLLAHAYHSGGAVFYRPLSTASFALDRTLFGVWAPGFHAHNLLWHLLATLLVWRLFARLVDARAAWVAALLFALHPVHTEAVTGVIGRSELMATALVLAGCILHLSDDPRRRALALLACLGALLAKESGVALPALALLLDARRRPWREAAWRALPFAVPLAVYAGLRVHALAGEVLPPPATYFAVATPAQAFFTAVDVLGRDLALLVWPHRLSADYSYPALPLSSGLTSARTLATLAAIALLVLAARARRGRPPWLGLALAWFAIAILPVSNLVVHIGVLMAERLLYLPSVAVCLVGGGLALLLVERARPAAARLAVAAVALSFGALTLARNVDWQTPLALWRDTVAKEPDSALAHANLALSCVVVHDPVCARAELARAVALDPTRADFRAALDELTRPAGAR